MGQPVCNYCNDPIAVYRTPEGEYKCDHVCNPARREAFQVELTASRGSSATGGTAPSPITPLDVTRIVKLLTDRAEVCDSIESQALRRQDPFAVSDAEQAGKDASHLRALASQLPELIAASTRLEAAERDAEKLSRQATSYKLAEQAALAERDEARSSRASLQEAVTQLPRYSPFITGASYVAKCFPSPGGGYLERSEVLALLHQIIPQAGGGAAQSLQANPNNTTNESAT